MTTHEFPVGVWQKAPHVAEHESPVEPLGHVTDSSVLEGGAQIGGGGYHATRTSVCNQRRTEANISLTKTTTTEENGDRQH